MFTRVGTAVLAILTSGEYARDDVAGAVPGLVATTAKITPAMCVFTAAGC